MTGSQRQALHILPNPNLEGQQRPFLAAEAMPVSSGSFPSKAVDAALDVKTRGPLGGSKWKPKRTPGHGPLAVGDPPESFSFP